MNKQKDKYFNEFVNEEVFSLLTSTLKYTEGKLNHNWFILRNTNIKGNSQLFFIFDTDRDSEHSLSLK